MFKQRSKERKPQKLHFLMWSSLEPAIYLPPPHTPLFSVNMAHLWLSDCFNCSLIFHLCSSYQSSSSFSFSPFSLLASTGSSPPFISAMVDLCEGVCRSEPPTRVEIKVVTFLITQSNLFPLLLCTTLPCLLHSLSLARHIITFFAVSLFSLVLHHPIATGQ